MVTVTLRGTDIRVNGKTRDAAIRALGRKLGYSRSQIDRLWMGGLDVLGEGLYMMTLAMSPTERDRAKGINASSVIGEIIISEDGTNTNQLRGNKSWLL